MSPVIFVLLILVCAVIFGIMWFKLTGGIAKEASRMDFN